jgi:hypothetical protein
MSPVQSVTYVPGLYLRSSGLRPAKCFESAINDDNGRRLVDTAPAGGQPFQAQPTQDRSLPLVGLTGRENREIESAAQLCIAADAASFAARRFRDRLNGVRSEV